MSTPPLPQPIKAFSAGDWPRTSGAERAALLRRVAARIEAELDELALIETLESGKPISQAKDEVPVQRASGTTPPALPSTRTGTPTTTWGPTTWR